MSPRAATDRGSSPPPSSAPASIGERTRHIKNKHRREDMYAKLKKEQMKVKKTERQKRQKARAEAIELGQEPIMPKQRTVESQRVKDETMVAPDDQEIQADEAQDEFSAHFACVRPPKVMVTTSRRISKHSCTFISEFMEMLPCATFCERRGYDLKDIVKFANNREFSDIIVFHEDKKDLVGFNVIHLPEGPTARFRILTKVTSAQIPDCGRATEHKPELILNGFNTRLGHRIGRQFASLFHQDPQFRGRRVVTFHNQRDYIFVRHHRYIFEEKDIKKKKVLSANEKKNATTNNTVVKSRLQELGPRMTLKLESLQQGTFNSAYGEFEFVMKRGDKINNKKKFAL